jgi:hypothetical protein
VNVELGSGEAYSEMDIELDYNPTYLQYVSSEKKISYDGTLTNTVSSEKNASVKLSLPDKSSQNYITSGGTAFTATFKVIKLDTTSSNSLQAFNTHTLASGVDDIKPPAASSRVYISCAHRNTITSVTKAATCTEWGEEQTKCTECGSSTYKSIPKTEHSKTEKITKEATCTQKGEKQIVCSKCNKVISTEEIPATGHNYGAWTVVKAATVDAEGSEERTCSVCGNSESRAIAKLAKPQGETTTQSTEQQTTEVATESTEQQSTETTTQSTEQQKAENTVTEAPATTEKTAQSRENKKTESTANSVSTGDATPVVLLGIICTLAFVGVTLTIGINKK